WGAITTRDLRTALSERAGPADASVLRPPRKLFARALDTPGGLKVLTIHAFCERLLHQFPFEARVAASFTVLDERQQDELVAEARDEVLMLAASAEENALSRALYTLVAETSDGAMQRALSDLLRNGEHVARLMQPAGADAGARVKNRTEAAFAISQGETSAAIDAEILDGGIAEARWPDFIAYLRSGTANDHKLAACLEAATAETHLPARRAIYVGLCLTKAFKPRSDKQFVTKALRDRRLDLYEELLRERERLAHVIER